MTYEAARRSLAQGLHIYGVMLPDRVLHYMIESGVVKSDEELEQGG